MKSSHSIKRVIVGLSGGVDSAVAALRLKEDGYEVEGLFMKNWEEDDDSDYCSAAIDLQDAQSVAARLDIPLHTRNFSAEYWDNVFSYFLAEYQAGRTPNPDVLCNREIKFKAFLDYALEIGADAIATGHYARIGQTDTTFQLLKGLDANKDQSYFLYMLGQRALSKSLFPLGDLDKGVVRQMAKQAGFENHAKKDSTGICFVGERKFKEFLSRFLPAQPGRIETSTGQEIGRHDGLMYYTMGQRKGLGIGGLKEYSDDPWYVVAKDLEKNVLTVTQGQDDPLLYSSTLLAGQLHWVDGTGPKTPQKLYAKTRYRQPDQTCTLTLAADDHYHVLFDEPQRAVTPGQSVVFYDGENCLGGGIIESTQ